MSETGATAEQIEAAAERAWAASGSLVPFDDVEPGGWFADGDKRVLAKEWSQYLVPPGYQIVPAGAVTLCAEEAELGADGLSRLIARYESLANEHDRSGRTEQWLWEQNNAAKFSALAAKLSGGAS